MQNIDSPPAAPLWGKFTTFYWDFDYIFDTLLNSYFSLLPFLFSASIGMHNGEYSISVDAAHSDLVFDMLDPTNFMSFVSFGIDDGGVSGHDTPSGINIKYFIIPPCVVGTPHNHPYSYELYHILESNLDLESGYVAKNGSTITLKNIQPGYNIFFSPDEIQWLYNKSCSKSARGVLLKNTRTDRRLPEKQLAAIPQDIVQASMGARLGRLISTWAEDKARVGLPVYQSSECMRRCGFK